jgi:hypothetical protein
MQPSLEAGRISVRHLAQREELLPKEGSAMKKIVLITAAVASLGLAACGGKTEATNEANTAETNTEATTNEAVSDTNAASSDAVTAADNALDSAGNALSAAGNAVENSAEAVANVASNTAGTAVDSTKKESKK